ncbi:MAG: hypothetical protein ABSE57_21385, partial [Bryobacteraceae bacterium]
DPVAEEDSQGEPALMEPKEKKKLEEALTLLMIIADSEKARREGRWVTQEQMEELMHEKFGT